MGGLEPLLAQAKAGGNPLPASLLLVLVSALLTLAVGGRLLPLLRQWKIGKQVRDDGPASHQVKTGTPTMGGLMIVVSVVVLGLAAAPRDPWQMVTLLGGFMAAALLGVVDDRFSLVGGARRGLSMRTKLLALTPIAAAVTWGLYAGGRLATVHLPGIGSAPLGWVGLVVAVVAIVGTANAVNLTDGLDTLAGGTLVMAFGAYGVLGLARDNLVVADLCFIIVGGLLAFLWFNAHPAQVFMGDTGALALGTALASVALATGDWLVLPIIGLVYVAVTVSVILQVACFKATRGRRLFKMAPLHHHFELSGWKETQVTTRFWVVATLAAVCGVALALA